MRAAVSSVLPFLRYAVTPVAQNVWLSIFVVISAARARRGIIALVTQDNLEHERTSTGGESAALIEKSFGLRQSDIIAAIARSESRSTNRLNPGRIARLAIRPRSPQTKTPRAAKAGPDGCKRFPGAKRRR